MTDPTTHHATCYREHHECAVARLDRLREEFAWEEPDLIDRLRESHNLMDVCDARLPSVCHALEDARDILVVVRDITEGR